MVSRGEPATLLSTEVMRPVGQRFMSIPRLFNAGLVLLDGHEAPLPYLAQNLPDLQGESWRILPDGRMETIFTLRPSIRWHDGAPLSAEDFVFAWQVFQSVPEKQTASAALSQIEDVQAPSEPVVLIRWKTLYPAAAALEAHDFQPLPRHLLRPAFQKDPTAFWQLPFWTRQYVGLGPYRLSDWKPGTSLSATAVDGHPQGQPRIERLTLLFKTDFENVLATLLSGQAQATIDDALRVPQAAILRAEWVAGGRGSLIGLPNQWRHIEVQQRIEYATPRMLLDVRVRRALASSLDRDALNAALFGGEATIADSFIPPTADTFQVVDELLSRYPYDPARAARLMREAGYIRASDGFYVHPTEGRFSAELRAPATQHGENEILLLADQWRHEGFDIHEGTLTPAQVRNGETRSSYASLFSTATQAGTDALPKFLSTNIPSARNGWSGSNRGGWTNPDYDALYGTFTQALDRTERGARIAQMARLISRSLAAISLYFSPRLVAYASQIRGPEAVAPASDPTWNIHQWEITPS
jgi:peptide/nickel transport system substrate-binding protein